MYVEGCCGHDRLEVGVRYGVKLFSGRRRI